MDQKGSQGWVGLECVGGFNKLVKHSILYNSLKLEPSRKCWSFPHKLSALMSLQRGQGRLPSSFPFFVSSFLLSFLSCPEAFALA